MRRILLAATAAAWAGGLGVAAHAQTAAPAPAPVVNTGIPSWVYAPFTSPPGPTPLPGQMTAYFRGRMHFDAALATDTLFNYNGGKMAPYQLGEYMRFYSGFDGTLANGLKYGAFVEVRQNSSSTTPGNAFPTAISASGQTGNNTLIFRSAHSYFGGNWGQFRFGQTYDAINTLLTGTFENFDDGGWNGDLPGFFTSTAAVSSVYPFDDNSGVYGTSKLVYLSPRFYGFDGAISWQPYTASSGEPQCANATQNCANLIAAGVNNANNQLQRNVNLVDGAIRYTGSFGPVGLVATIGGAVWGTVSNNGMLPTLATFSASSPGTKNGTLVNYKDGGAYDSGLIVTFGGLAVGGHIIGGTMNTNGSNDFLPVAKGYPNQIAFVIGTSYAWGPFIVGASWLSVEQAGAFGTLYAPLHPGQVPTRFGYANNQGLALGGTFAYGPGAQAFLSFLYGRRHQAGYNFAADTRGPSYNTLFSRGVIIGNTFNW
jgi:hypothetical protein